MPSTPPCSPIRSRHALAAGLLSLAALLAPAASRADATELRASHAQLRDQLRPNAHGHALHIDSVEQQDRLTGDVFAVLDHPFAKVSAALREPANWCDILILPFNTKSCHVQNAGGDTALLVRIGRKYDQPPEQAYRLQFGWRSAASQPDYFETRLQAADGPVGTRDYRIQVSATPIEGGRTFLRLNYSYGFGFSGRMAMQAYLGTVGADKVGFTVTGRDRDGQPQYIRGVRGAIERTSMRYYLAIDAYLQAASAPAPQQLERRLQAWFDSSERYPRQLHEMDRSTYLSMKRHEVERQQTALRD
ncbi:MAG TPA: hypothetical protein VFE82_10470 [Ramlibacter sp.]|jgi:hypothetical protein|uniref:hypothetical protein n=1 Tax=Ramlibacter sp. TaxID=1917967 RepID=UPI002D4D917E|nr:hypothetical protein [Ramlibacter sp.]HZY18896.1 hypothetical protein [Ramlibacter sp.]